MPSPRPLSQMTLGNPVVCTPRPSKTLAIQLVAVIAFGRHAVHIITIRGSAAGDVGERYGTSSSALYPKTQLRVTRLLPAVTSAAGVRGRQTWLLSQPRQLPPNQRRRSSCPRSRTLTIRPPHLLHGVVGDASPAEGPNQALDLAHEPASCALEQFRLEDPARPRPPASWP